MHSSGFYWLGWTANGTGFSYTVTTNTFVLRLAVMSTHRDTCEPGKKAGDKAEACKSPENNSQNLHAVLLKKQSKPGM